MPSVTDDSEADDFDDDCLIFPLTDIDGDCDNNNFVGDKCNPSRKFAKAGNYNITSALGRRRRESVGCPLERSRGSNGLVQSIAIPRQLSLKCNGTYGSGHFGNGFGGTGPLSPLSSSPKISWMQAVRKIKQLKDPWEQYHILDQPSETAVRHRYNALKKQWVTDKVEVKVERDVSVNYVFMGINFVGLCC